MTAPYYITTPIYYVNDRPHIGHCYTTVIADILARFQRLSRGTPPVHGAGVAGGPATPIGPADVFLLTGTDEHADKVVTSAAANGHTPQDWCDRNAQAFRDAFAFFNVSNDDFIRTTEARHKNKVPGYISRLIASGDIYKGAFTGWYDESAEEYIPENTAREQDFKAKIGGKPLVKRTEDCYFFRLGKYQTALFNLISSNASFVQPDARRQEVLGRLRPPAVLNDVPVSRPVTDDPATRWGIRIPGDDAHRVYVWIDALFNYLSVVDTPERRSLWPASVHVIGKDILWFHAVIWPALLLALGEKLPHAIYGHGWWVSEGQKMSKSLGNFIDLERLRAYADRYSLDAVRWYLATQGPMGGTDADFSHAKFVEVYNAELANGIGNCASRVANMIEKYFGGEIPDPAGALTHEVIETDGVHRTFDWPALCEQTSGQVRAALESLDLSTALGHGVNLVRQVDVFINLTRPFSIAKLVEKGEASREGLGQVLYQCAEAIRIASVLMSTAMPVKMTQLWQTWNCVPPAGATLAELCAFGGAHALRPGQRIAKGDNLFTRANPADPAPTAP